MRRAFVIGAALVWGAATLAAAGLALQALVSSDSPAFGLALGFDSSASSLSAPNSRRSDLVHARTLTQKALAVSPYDTGAWLRLAYLDDRLNGHLTAEGVGALRASYSMIKFDQYVAFWRISFALEHWDALPDDVRTAVRNETFVVASNPGHRRSMHSLLAHVHNSPGKLVATLWRERLNDQALAADPSAPDLRPEGETEAGGAG